MGRSIADKLLSSYALTSSPMRRMCMTSTLFAIDHFLFRHKDWPNSIVFWNTSFAGSTGVVYWIVKQKIGLLGAIATHIGYNIATEQNDFLYEFSESIKILSLNFKKIVSPKRLICVAWPYFKNVLCQAVILASVYQRCQKFRA
jgi:hypothetical protein